MSKTNSSEYIKWFEITQQLQTTYCLHSKEKNAQIKRRNGEKHCNEILVKCWKLWNESVNKEKKTLERVNVMEIIVIINARAILWWQNTKDSLETLLNCVTSEWNALKSHNWRFRLVSTASAFFPCWFLIVWFISLICVIISSAKVTKNWQNPK